MRELLLYKGFATNNKQLLLLFTMVFNKNIQEGRTGNLEGIVNKALFFGSFCASLAAGMFLGELADVYFARPIAQKYSPELNPYLTFAASTATGMALTVLGWRKLIAPLFYSVTKNEEQQKDYK